VKRAIRVALYIVIICAAMVLTWLTQVNLVAAALIGGFVGVGGSFAVDRLLK
jgi:hypothetical protein